MGRFSVVAKAEARPMRKYFAKGKYKVRVAEVETYETDGVWNVAVKCEILTSSNPAIEEGEIRQVSWPLKKKHPGAQFFKQFIAASMGMDASDESISPEEWEKVSELVVGPKQPLTGKVLDAEVVDVIKNGEVMKTKSGDNYTNIDFKLAKEAA